MIRIYLSIILVFIFFTCGSAQGNSVRIGGGIGFGSIKGNLPSQTSFSGKFFVEVEPFIIPFNSIQFAFTFAQKLDRITPGRTCDKYYPFVNSFSLVGIGKQFVTKYLFIKEGFGLLVLNDRTYDDLSIWDYGFIFNTYGGTYFSEGKKIEISFGFDYGLTFTNTNTSYFVFFLQMNYFL